MVIHAVMKAANIKKKKYMSYILKISNFVFI